MLESEPPLILYPNFVLHVARDAACEALSSTAAASAPRGSRVNTVFWDAGEEAPPASPAATRALSSEYFLRQ